MSIATVITGGFGSFGSVAFVIRDGYASGDAPPEPTVTANTGGWLPEHRQYTAKERRQRGLEWQKADPKELRAALEKAYAEAIGSPVEPDAEAAPIIEAIRPFAASGYDTPAPPVASVDWTAVAGNIAAIEALFDRVAAIRRRRLAAAAILLLSV